ncbi:DinI-like family protein [Hafnia paralvei]|uniref:DinI-like family protein n=1 Tax=Hafnia paralvei TaxID=546367 RepID=UPI00398B8227
MAANHSGTKKRPNKKYMGTESSTRFDAATDIVITSTSKDTSKMIRKMLDEMFEDADK